MILIETTRKENQSSPDTPANYEKRTMVYIDGVSVKAEAEVSNSNLRVAHRMNNETSKEVENFIQSQTNLQCVQLGRHSKPAEKAVQTYKACFKSTTASLPPEFPISHWCRLIDKVDFSVNIM